MRHLTAVLFAVALCVPPSIAQERSAPKKAPGFAEAVENAKKAAEAEKIGAAIAALQAAIRDLQKKQRAQVLEAMPKPAGWEVQDDAVDESTEAISAGLAAMGASTARTYRKGDHSIRVEVTANSPLMQMVAVMFQNPTLIEANGGELVKYGTHKAILKKSGDNGQELQLLMHDQHLVKVDAQGVSADDLLKIFDQAFVDRLEKPLGK
jgi:hypothetical protein